MSFLLDPPLLVGAGVVAESLPDARTRANVERVVLGVFIGTSVSLYVNARWTAWLWRLCGATSGRDWMLNSGVTRFEHERPKPIVHLLALVMFAAYPVWYRLGSRLGSSRRGR